MIPRLTKTARAPRLVVLALLCLPVVSCDTPTLLRGAALSTYLAAVSIEDIRGHLNPGPPPPPGAGPSVTLPTNSEAITGGSTALDLVGSSAFRSVVVFVDGVDGHYVVDLPADISIALAIMTIGGRVPTLDFDVVYAVAGADGIYGPYRTISVQALAVAGGDVQVSVTWDTDADVDLHVVEPNGEELYYGSRTSGSGGELDIDANAACSTSTLFQENIGWAANTAPSGQYIVRLDYWSSCGAPQTDYIVTVNLRPGTPNVPGLPGGGVQIFTGTFTGLGTSGGAGDGIPITTFVF